MATVVIPALLRKLTGGAERVTVGGGSLQAIIDELERQFPGMRASLLDGNDLNGSIAVWIDGEPAIEGLMAMAGEQSEIHFLPAIGGGCSQAAPRF